MTTANPDRQSSASSDDLSVRRSVHRSADRCLVFLHIPKTAGQTLRSSLALNFPKDRQINLDILDKPLDKELEKIPLEARSSARLVWGHMPYGIHRHLPQACEYFTVLREPVARVVSVYKYILRATNHVLHDRVVGQGIPLEEYVESGVDESQTENSQTRQLSGRQFGPLDREALEEAKKNLEGFLVVGLTERFDETFVLLRRELRLRVPVYMTRNVSPPFDVSRRALELIQTRNHLDLEVYRFAQDLFVQQVARQGHSFGLEVAAYRAFRPISRMAGPMTNSLLHKLPGRTR